MLLVLMEVLYFLTKELLTEHEELNITLTEMMNMTIENTENIDLVNFVAVADEDADAVDLEDHEVMNHEDCLLYTSPSPRDRG